MTCSTTMTFRLWLLCAAALFGAAPPLHAEETAAYFGLKAGAMRADSAGMHAVANAGLTLGYGRDALAAEAEITRSLRRGATVDSDTHWGITTLAAYGVYRTSGTWYLKIKAGMLYEQITFKTSGLALPDSVSGGSAGAGFGWLSGGGRRLELEYTLVERDVALLSVGYHF